jgi:hypothetical protein
MALRRPPTRIELKDSDIAEYDEIVKERLAREGASSINNRKGFKVKSEGPTSQTSQKPSAAERIGITRPR